MENNKNDYQNLLATIGKNIAKYRKIKNFTQPQLAGLVGLKKNTISQMERGAQGLSVKSLYEVASTLNINVCDFFEDEDIFIVSKSDVIKSVFVDKIKKTDIERFLKNA